MDQARDTIEDYSSTLDSDRVPLPTVLFVASGHELTPRVVLQGLGRIVIGRSVTTTGPRLVIDDGRMSREHAVVERLGSIWLVRDLDSRNGTYVDGERIVGQAQVAGEAVVRCGHTVLLLLEQGRDAERRFDIGSWVVGAHMARVLAEVRREPAAPSLLVQGEAGTGKSLVARECHARGPRAAGPLVTVECARQSSAEALIGRSGPDGAVAGAAQCAEGGTLLLEDVGELGPEAQEALLRLLVSREVQPVGAAAPVTVDVGVVATTTRDLRAAVSAQRFREDLYELLSGRMVVVPPLRERRADIPRLVVREVHQAERRLSIHPRLLETCCARPWPGNVPELQRAVREAVAAAVAAGRDVVRPEDLPLVAGLVVREDSPSTLPSSMPGYMAQRRRIVSTEVERGAVEAALESAGGNLSAAARILGLHRTQLYRLVQKFGVTRHNQGT